MINYTPLIQPDSYLTKRNNHLNSLDTCIISSESESDALSFSLHFCNGLICRTTSVSLEVITLLYRILHPNSLTLLTGPSTIISGFIQK